jgi:hypothetical protein
MENFEKLEKVANCHIEDQTALKAFLKYSKVNCGWFPYSLVNPEDVRNCLDNFKKDHPEYLRHIS